MKKHKKASKLKARLAISMMILTGFALTSLSILISIGSERL